MVPILIPSPDTSGLTHLLEAVLIPGIIIARIVTGKVGGMNLEQKRDCLQRDSEAKPQRGPIPTYSCSTLISPPELKTTGLTLRTPNSPRTTRLRISSTAWDAAIIDPST